MCRRHLHTEESATTTLRTRARYTCTIRRPSESIQLSQILNKYGVPEETITVLKKLHTNVKYLLRVGKEKVEIEATVGVIQGNDLGPILFISYSSST